MRSHPLDITLDSDIDLRALACKRVSIEQLPDGRYRLTSAIRLYRCEGASFAHRLLRRRRPGMQAYSGNASRPTGYYWRHDWRLNR
jgi:hypothetical protein